MVLTREDQNMDMDGKVGVEAPEGLASDSCGKDGGWNRRNDASRRVSFQFQKIMLASKRPARSLQHLRGKQLL